MCEIKAQNISQPDGYAGYAGTTGGGGATSITVSTPSDFKTAASGNNAAVIYVDGFLNVGNMSIGSNKTIVGLTETSGLGGGTIEVDGSNCIFQNLIFVSADPDVMEISGGTKIFITRCAFHDAGDELCSVVRGADFVTISWCKFYFDNTHSHAFVQLIGNRDDRTSDRGKLHVTLHHNWYGDGIRGRMPRVRYGQVHIYNNYYNCVGNGYCIGTGYECHIRLENSVFENINNPWQEQALGALQSGGEIGWNNIKFIGCNQPSYITNSYPVFEPPYEFNIDPIEIVKTRVTERAGNVFNNYPRISLIKPVDKDTFSMNSTIILEAEALVEDGTISKVQFFCDTLLGEDSIAPFSFNWEPRVTGIYNIPVKAFDNTGNSSISEPIQIHVQESVEVSQCNDTRILVRPNPTSNILKISVNENGSYNTHVILKNSHGSARVNQTFTEKEFILNFNAVPSGLYIIAIENENVKTHHRIIKY